MAVEDPTKLRHRGPLSVAAAVTAVAEPDVFAPPADLRGLAPASGGDSGAVAG
jgi:hypothetical protein